LAQAQTLVADADKTKVEASLAAPVPVARAYQRPGCDD